MSNNRERSLVESERQGLRDYLVRTQGRHIQLAHLVSGLTPVSSVFARDRYTNRLVTSSW